MLLFLLVLAALNNYSWGASVNVAPMEKESLIRPASPLKWSCGCFKCDCVLAIECEYLQVSGPLATVWEYSRVVTYSNHSDHLQHYYKWVCLHCSQLEREGPAPIAFWFYLWHEIIQPTIPLLLRHNHILFGKWHYIFHFHRTDNN